MGKRVNISLVGKISQPQQLVYSHCPAYSSTEQTLKCNAGVTTNRHRQRVIRFNIFMLAWLIKRSSK